VKGIGIVKEEAVLGNTILAGGVRPFNRFCQIGYSNNILAAFLGKHRLTRFQVEELCVCNALKRISSSTYIYFCAIFGTRRHIF